MTSLTRSSRRRSPDPAGPSNHRRPSAAPQPTPRPVVRAASIDGTCAVRGLSHTPAGATARCRTLLRRPTQYRSMAFARNGTGLRAPPGALASQLPPVFMLPPVAASPRRAAGARPPPPTRQALVAPHAPAAGRTHGPVVLQVPPAPSTLVTKNSAGFVTSTTPPPVASSTGHNSSSIPW